MTWIDDNLILIGSLHKYLFDSSDEDHVNILHYLDWLEDARLMTYSTCEFFLNCMYMQLQTTTIVYRWRKLKINASWISKMYLIKTTLPLF